MCGNLPDFQVQSVSIGKFEIGRFTGPAANYAVPVINTSEKKTIFYFYRMGCIKLEMGKKKDNQPIYFYTGQKAYYHIKCILYLNKIVDIASFFYSKPS